MPSAVMALYPPGEIFQAEFDDGVGIALQLRNQVPGVRVHFHGEFYHFWPSFLFLFFECFMADKIQLSRHCLHSGLLQGRRNRACVSLDALGDGVFELACKAVHAVYVGRAMDRDRAGDVDARAAAGGP